MWAILLLFCNSLLFLTCLNGNSHHVTEIGRGIMNSVQLCRDNGKASQRWWRLWHLRCSWSRGVQLHVSQGKLTKHQRPYGSNTTVPCQLITIHFVITNECLPALHPQLLWLCYRITEDNMHCMRLYVITLFSCWKPSLSYALLIFIPVTQVSLRSDVWFEISVFWAVKLTGR
jgi:hypothetical protein